MHSRGRSIRLTAVAALVVLSLTGFSTSRGHGHGSSHGSGGGGGCSSSSQDHDSSSSSGGGSSGSRYHDYDDDDDYDTGSSGGSSGTTSSAARDATVELVSCVTEADAYATVEVTNPNSTGYFFTITVKFLDAKSDQVDLRTVDEFVAANDTAKVQVPLANPGLAAKVDRCAPEPSAPAD
ncbi:hypothetical protein [Streptomyces griseus]|uniref:hypothetical protein n=1 Tax=Streptomyces griseus TaxID=1911 RepID=UPI00056AF168|nr:hypothetical protein [Streptomyces griseus]